MSEGWTPRIKRDYAELFLSVGTGYQNRWVSGLTSLTEVSTGGHSAPRIWAYPNELASKGPQLVYCCQSEDMEGVREELAFAKHFDFTLHQGRDHGNPHAVVFPDGSWIDQLQPYNAFFQIGAFLGFPEMNADLQVVERRLIELNEKKV